MFILQSHLKLFYQEERNFLYITCIFVRSILTQERLDNLVLLSIECELTSVLNFDDIINEFASREARKVVL